MHTYKLTNKETGEVKFAVGLIEAGQGYDILAMEDGTQERVENVEMDGSNLTSEIYTVEKVEEATPEVAEAPIAEEVTPEIAA